MLILFDLDDTLLNSDTQVTQFTVDTLKYFQKKGHLLAINSARPYLFSKYFSDLIGCDYNICNGGTEIFKGNQRIYFKPITKEEVNDFLKECSSDFVNLTVQSDYAYSSDEGYAKENDFARYYDFSKPFFEDAAKIVVDSVNDEHIKKYCDEHDLVFCKYLNQSWCRISSSDKAKGMKALVNLLGDIETVAFGDDTGDVEMMEEATYGVCLLNSRPNVLKAISTVTDKDCNHDGVAYHLLKMEAEGIL